MALARGLAAPAPVRAAAPGAGLGWGQVQPGLAGPRTRAAAPPVVRTAVVTPCPRPRVGAAVAPRTVVAGRGVVARVAAAVAAGRVVAGGVVARGSAAVAAGRVVAGGVVARVAAAVAAGRVMAGGVVARGSAVGGGWVIARPVRPGSAGCVVARRVASPPVASGAVSGLAAGALARVVPVPPGAGLLPRLSPPAVGTLTALPSCPFALPALTCRPLGGVSVAPPIRRRRLGSAQRRSSTSTADGSPATKPRSKPGRSVEPHYPAGGGGCASSPRAVSSRAPSTTVCGRP